MHRLGAGALMHHALGIETRGPVTWRTPRWLFKELDREFRFTLDAAADHENHLCTAYLAPDQDSLEQPWPGVVFLNPPYDRTLGAWIKKAWEEAQKGATVVCLVPVRSDLDWWHRYATRGEIRWILGRLRFSGSKVDAPFPSAILVFRRQTHVASHAKESHVPSQS